MLCVSTISVLGFFGSTLPKTLRAIPGLKSLVSFESMVNCFTFPCGTPSTTLRSGAALYSGPTTKLSYASSGGFSPAFNTLNGGAPGSSNLRTGCATDDSANRSVTVRIVAHGLDMRYLVSIVLRFPFCCSGSRQTSDYGLRKSGDFRYIGQSLPNESEATTKELLIGASGGQAQGFLPGVCGGGVLAGAVVELANDGVPRRIAGGDVVSGNGGEPIERSLWAVQVCLGDGAIERVDRRRRDAVEHVVQFGDAAPIGVGEGRRPA